MPVLGGIMGEAGVVARVPEYRVEAVVILYAAGGLD